MITRQVVVDFAKQITEERSVPLNRALTDQEKRQWRKEHPAVFLGHYGYYDRFCGLNCGCDWAVAHTRSQIGVQR